MRRVRHLLTCGECPSGDEMDVALKQAAGDASAIPSCAIETKRQRSTPTDAHPSRGTSGQTSLNASSLPFAPTLMKIQLEDAAQPPYKTKSVTLKSKWRRHDRKRLESLRKQRNQEPKSQKLKLLGLFHGHRLVGKGQKPRRIPIENSDDPDLVSDPRISLESTEILPGKKS